MNHYNVTILLLLLAFSLQAQQTSISGIVSIHNSKYETKTKEYVHLAEVEDDFDKATPATTDKNGLFKLIYVGVPEKERVNFSVKKEGLEVVNLDKLEAITDQKEVIKISMARPEYLADFRKNIYNVGLTSAEKALNERIAAVKKQWTLEKEKSSERNERIIQLEKEYSRLIDELQQVDQRAQDLAKKYERINLDEVSPLYETAFRHFQNGALDKALEVLKQADLAQQAQNILTERNKISENRIELDQRDSIQRIRTQEVMQALRFQADLYRTRLEFDSVKSTYKTLLSLDTTHVNNLWEIAYFYADQNQQKQALALYEKALSHCQSKIDSASLLNNYGNQLTNNNAYEKAEQAYLAALSIRERLAKTNAEKYEPDVAMTQNNLGTMYSDLNAYEKAEQAYLAALSIYERLAKTNAEKYEPDVAMTQNNLGNMYLAALSMKRL